MPLCITSNHAYRETPSKVSCPGCPRCILLRSACRSCTGAATRMQSSCTVICDHRGFVYSPIRSTRLIVACCPPLFAGPSRVATLLGTGVAFRYLSCFSSDDSLWLLFLFSVMFLWPLLLLTSRLCCTWIGSPAGPNDSPPCRRFSVPGVNLTTSHKIGYSFFLTTPSVSLIFFLCWILNCFYSIADRLFAELKGKKTIGFLWELLFSCFDGR